MFDIGWSELVLIGVVALIVVGPRDLPAMFRTLGRLTGKARMMARDFQRAMEDAADESGLKDISRDLNAIRSPLQTGLGSLNRKLDDWEPPKRPAPAPRPDAVVPEAAVPDALVPGAGPAGAGPGAVVADSVRPDVVGPGVGPGAVVADAVVPETVVPGAVVAHAAGPDAGVREAAAGAGPGAVVPQAAPAPGWLGAEPGADRGAAAASAPSGIVAQEAPVAPAPAPRPAADGTGA